MDQLGKKKKLSIISSSAQFFQMSHAACQNFYVQVAKNKKDTAISQIQKILFSQIQQILFSKNIRFYYLIFIYSCIHELFAVVFTRFNFISN